MNDGATYEFSLPDAREAVRIIPLGGLGEVGRNCNVFEYQGRIVVVDCGVLFPEEEHPGIDLILPDLDYLVDHIDNIEGIVLTHGHEDHIGALPYLLKHRPDIPLIGSPLTIAFAESKLKEHKITPYTLIVREGDRENVGPFDMEFIAVNHSVPDALAVFIRSEQGNIFVTGDFKIDQLPIDDRLTDLRAFARIGEEGVDVFMCDSTNADTPGFIRSESEIGPVIDEVIARAQGQVVVASFASHVHRVQQVLNAAAANGRKVAFVGRSMLRNMSLAQELGHLTIPSGVLVDLKDMAHVPENQRVYMSTGSQGEPMAVLARISRQSHKQISVNRGDTVIFASSLIVGNENSVFRLINALTKLGADVIHQGNASVHVSGHAAQGELLYTYNLLQPAYAFPIHGEERHQVANGALAIKTGVPPENVILAENASVIDMHDGQASIVGSIPFRNIYVDGQTVGAVTDDELQERRILSSEGFIAIYATVDTSARTIIAGPHIQSRAMAEDDTVFEAILPAVRTALHDALDAGEEIYRMQQAMRRVIGRWASRTLRRSPMIIPTVVDISKDA